MLEVQDLWAGYGDVAVVRGVSLRVRRGSHQRRGQDGRTRPTRARNRVAEGLRAV
jgi:ABC-type histidine transport system ATPase subunit